MFATNTTRGTQDVNDPERGLSRFGGPQAGSFTSWVPLLRWSEPVLGRQRAPTLVARGTWV